MNLEQLSGMVISILAGLFFAYFLIESYGLAWRLRRIFKLDPNKRLRPFDCQYCMSGWLSIGFYLLPINLTVLALCLFGGAYLSKFVK